MATQFQKLDIFNAALLAIGEEEVADNDGTPAWRVLDASWPAIVEAELEDSNYDFTKVEANLVTRVAGKYGFNDGFQIPAAALHIRKVWIQDTSTTTGSLAGLTPDLPTTDRLAIDWVADASYVYVNKSDGIWVEYLQLPNPDQFSATFVRGIQLKMQAVGLRSLREEYGEADRLDAQAEGLLQRARAASTRRRSQQPSSRMGHLARARFYG